jgi:predicted lipoprotein with Yx(FWY)xxD motif
MSKLTLGATALVAGAALIAAACGGGTSSTDKTATAGAGGAGTTPAASSTPYAVATTAATTAATTPAAGATAPGGTTGAATGVMVGTSAVGQILTDDRGFTLYTFTKDVAGSGASAAEALVAIWPPLSLSAAPASVTGATGAWDMFTRVDGKTQITYKGMPLYYFASDKAPGDTKGDKVGGVWFAAVP